MGWVHGCPGLSDASHLYNLAPIRFNRARDQIRDRGDVASEVCALIGGKSGSLQSRLLLAIRDEWFLNFPKGIFVFKCTYYLMCPWVLVLLFTFAGHFWGVVN